MPEPNPPQRFAAVLEHEGAGLGWVVVRVPFDPAAVWTTRVRQRVCGSVAGVAVRSSLFADARGPFLLVTRAVQEAAGIALGSRVEVELQPDLEPRPASLPDELLALLDEEPGLRAFYDGLGESMRREIGKWVDNVKSDAARQSRAQDMAERLLATLEAEHSLPPVLEQAFRAQPLARRGWDTASPSHRHRELMALFSYKSPESRARRLQVLVEKYAARAR